MTKTTGFHGVGFFALELLRAARLLRADRRAGCERIKRGIGVLRAALLFRGCELGELVNALGTVRVLSQGRIRIGDRVQFSRGMIATEILCRSGAELLVGPKTLFSYGVSIQATESVRIGARCMFGSMARVTDEGQTHTAPVVIGDDVWVAHGAIVEPGVTIGEGAVVSAGSVVHDDVPPYSLAVGNPARCRPLKGVRKVPVGEAGVELEDSSDGMWLLRVTAVG